MFLGKADATSGERLVATFMLLSYGLHEGVKFHKIGKINTSHVMIVYICFKLVSVFT